MVLLALQHRVRYPSAMSEVCPHIAVIGGGAGSKAVLSGLRQHDVRLSAVVNMADNGGSTGMLRQEFGVMPPGDVRQAISALSDAPMDIRELFEHRFSPESQLAGHSFGNLIIAAAELVEGDIGSAINRVSKHMGVKGRVLPVTLDLHDLALETHNQRIVGEYEIGGTPLRPLEEKPTLWLEPAAALNPEADFALMDADMIVVAPGDLYGSLIPTLLVDGMRNALTYTQAEVVYMSNLVNKPHQTAGFSPADYAHELERAAGTPFIDSVVYNSEPLGSDFVATYGKPGEQALEPIVDTLMEYQYMGADLVARHVDIPRHEGPICRSYIRHDPAKLAKAIMGLMA